VRTTDHARIEQVKLAGNTVTEPLKMLSAVEAPCVATKTAATHTCTYQLGRIWADAIIEDNRRRNRCRRNNRGCNHVSKEIHTGDAIWVTIAGRGQRGEAIWAATKRDAIVAVGSALPLVFLPRITCGLFLYGHLSSLRSSRLFLNSHFSHSCLRMRKTRHCRRHREKDEQMILTLRRPI
jgi:hypothetical protein